MDGNQVTREGIKVINIKTTNSAGRKTKIPEYISVNFSFATLDVTKSVIPTGGVINPMQRLITTTIPKWRGSIPKFSATGSRIGTIINNAGD